MKKFPFIGLTALTAVIFLPSVTIGGLVNGSFEYMNFYGWTLELGQGTSTTAPFSRTAGAAGSIVSWVEPSGTTPAKTPEAGLRFAAFHTRPNANFIGDGSYDISLNQVVQLNQGDLLSGWSSFYNGDTEPQDSAWVKIFDLAGNQIASPWQAISGTPADPNATLITTTSDWTRWEWQVPDTGSYSIQLGMTTGGDNTSASYGFFDGLSVQPASSVPEPGSLALAITGSLLFAAFRRKNG